MRLELVVWRQVLWLQTPLCSAGPITAAALHTTWYQQHWRPPTTSPAARVAFNATWVQAFFFQLHTKKSAMKPTVHVVSQCSLQLSQRVAPGTKLQQPQRRGHAQRRHDQVGVVLRLGEHLVEADGEPGVELLHAVLKAAVTVAPLRQPEANEEWSYRQATHILSAAGGEASTGCNKKLKSYKNKRQKIWKCLKQHRVKWKHKQSCSMAGSCNDILLIKFMKLLWNQLTVFIDKYCDMTSSWFKRSQDCFSAMPQLSRYDVRFRSYLRTGEVVSV